MFNFNEVKGAISGPVAIVAVGAEVARNDVTGLFQFAAIVNINLAVINALPLPVCVRQFLIPLIGPNLRLICPNFRLACHCLPL